MKSLRCADLTVADIREIVTVQEQPLAAYPWTQVDPLGLSEQEREHVAYIQQRLRMMDTSLMNEATIWGRAIYPMLILAEQGPVQAWAQVTLHARYPHVELHGVVDGVLGRGLQSMTETTYLGLTRWSGQFAFSPSAEWYFVSFSLQIFAVGENLE